MSTIKLTVTVDDAHVASTASVAAALSRQGFAVESVMPEEGAIFGSATSEIARDLDKTIGVLEVRPSREFQLPDFDESVPQ